MIFTFPQKIFLNGQNLSKQKYRPKITYGGEEVNIHALYTRVVQVIIFGSQKLLTPLASFIRQKFLDKRNLAYVRHFVASHQPAQIHVTHYI